MSQDLPEPCPRCYALYKEGRIDGETVMPLPEGVRASRSFAGQRQCADCALAETAIKMRYFPNDAQGFLMGRIAVGNDRRELLRLPAIKIGVFKPLMRDVDFATHIAWLDAQCIEQNTKFQPQNMWTQAEAWLPGCNATWDTFITTHAGEHNVDVEHARMNIVVSGSKQFPEVRVSIETEHGGVIYARCTQAYDEDGEPLHLAPRWRWQ